MPADDTTDPTFAAFAAEWWEGKRLELRPTTVAAYEYELRHLLRFFGDLRLSEITVREVDRYRRAQVAAGRLSATYVNATLTRLAQILELAVEYELIARNPAAGRRRRLRAPRPRPVHLDAAEQITALLDAAAELDAAATARTGGRRALVATLVFAGLRVSEACALTWADVDLDAGRLAVGAAKTDAGVREVDLLPVLRGELLAHRDGVAGGADAPPAPAPAAPVFPTARGTRRTKDNVRQRVIVPVVARAGELLERRGQRPLPAGVTAHKLRHTFASLLIARGEDPAFVMAQLGHTDPAFTLRVYAHAMRRRDGERERLRALVEGTIS